MSTFFRYISSIRLGCELQNVALVLVTSYYEIFRISENRTIMLKLPPAKGSKKKPPQNKDLWNAIALQQNLLKDFRMDFGAKVPKPKVILVDDEPVQQLSLGNYNTSNLIHV